MTTPPTLPVPPISRAQSHQSGTITSHWNDLPAGYIPSPTSSLSRSVSRNSNLTPSNLTSTTPKETEPSTDEVLDLSTLLPALYTLPSTLTTQERGLLQTRINKSLLPKTGDGGVSEEQRTFIRGLLQDFVIAKKLGRKEVREEIVGFMRRESGVAGWAGAVRRVVEGVVEE